MTVEKYHKKMKRIFRNNEYGNRAFFSNHQYEFEKEYYISMVPMNLLSKLFSENTDNTVLPEYRAQRKLNESRIPIIANYILNNRSSYVFSALSAPHPVRLSIISPARRAASIFPVLMDITSVYRILIIREKSSIFYKLRKQVTLTAQKQVLHLRQVLRIQSAVQPALVPFSAHRHQEHIR